MTPRAGRWAPPISAQVMALLVGGLVAAQAATYALSTLLPASPPPEYRLADIAAALRGGALQGEGAAPLQRAVQARAPDPLSPGWQPSARARDALAGLLQADPADVEVLVYSPPPFAGAGERRTAGLASGLEHLMAAAVAPSASAAPTGSGDGGASGFGGMGGPGGMGPHGGGQGGRGGWGGGGSGGRSGGSRGGMGGPIGGQGPFGRGVDPPVAPVPQGAPDGGGPIGRGGPAGRGGEDGPIRTAPMEAGPIGPPDPLLPIPEPSAGEAPPPEPVAAAEPPTHLPRPPLWRASAPQRQAVPVDAVIAGAPQPARAPASPSPRPRAPARAAAAAMQLLPPPVVHTLFGLARTPVVDGEFLAAYRAAPGRWVTVRPVQDAVLSRWQRRVGLWFLAAFLAVAPLGWWMSRRLAAPLAALADTADRLGRDPSTPVPDAGGAPEIRRLAAALTGMQARLQRHVEDRTAMVGAISHDLRTPLARMRFKLERAPPALQASLLRDLAHMQEMLDAVLLFIRDASGPSPREVADLRSILECVVDDAALVGGEAVLEPGGPAAVEVDILAVQRVATNLVENALKYGGEAHVRLHSEGLEAVVQVRDRGSGLPEGELEQVFQPFYRSEAGRRTSAQGIGLGLSVSRAIARAHGGEVSLRNVEGGLLAELRLPLALARPVPDAEPEAALSPAA